MKPEAKSPHGGKDLTTGSIPRHLVAFAIPMLIGSALQTAYSIVNAIWVGKGLGTDAMVAVTVSFPIFFVLMAVAGGLTLATTVLVSQSYGAKDFDAMRRVIRNSVVLSIATSLICIAVGFLGAKALLRLLQTPADVLMLSANYFRIFVWTVPFMFGTFLIASILRGVGDSKTPLYFQAISVGITALLDPLLMFGWLGFPKLGLNGTAVATIVSQVLAVVSLCVYLHRKQHIASPNWLDLRADRATSLLTLRIGIPSMFQQALISMGMMTIVGLVNGFGKYGSAAFGVAMRLDQLAFMPAMTVGMAVSTLTGQNIGARHYERVQEVFKWGMLIACGLTAIPCLLSLSIPHLLMGLFVKDPKVIAIGVGYLRIVGCFYLCFAIMFVSNGVINGAGHTLETSIITLVGLWGIRIPLAAYLSRHLHRIEGIWYAIVIGFAVGTIASLSYYCTGRWKIPVRKGFAGRGPVSDNVDAQADAQG